MVMIPKPDVLDALVRCSRSNDDRLREWIRNYQDGLRPIGGVWRSPEEAATMWTRQRWRALSRLLEMSAIAFALLVADFVLVGLIRALFF